jgi:hypothetical protein
LYTAPFHPCDLVPLIHIIASPLDYAPTFLYFQPLLPFYRVFTASNIFIEVFTEVTYHHQTRATFITMFSLFSVISPFPSLFPVFPSSLLLVTGVVTITCTCPGFLTTIEDDEAGDKEVRDFAVVVSFDSQVEGLGTVGVCDAESTAEDIMAR